MTIRKDVRRRNAAPLAANGAGMGESYYGCRQPSPKPSFMKAFCNLLGDGAVWSLKAIWAIFEWLIVVCGAILLMLTINDIFCGGNDK